MVQGTDGSARWPDRLDDGRPRVSELQHPPRDSRREPTDPEEIARARTALRRFTDDAVQEVSISRLTRRSLERLGHTPEEFIARRAAALIVRREEHLERSYDATIAVARRAVREVLEELPEWLVTVSAVYRKHTANQAVPLERMQPKLPEIENFAAYLRIAVRREEAREAKKRRHELAGGLRPVSVAVVNTDTGEDHERPEMADPVDRISQADIRLDVERRLTDALEQVRESLACPACQVRGDPCRDGVEISWWLEAVESGLPAHEIVELGKSRCAIFRDRHGQVSDQNYSRNGYHGTGTLLHLFAAAEDQRLRDWILLDKGKDHHRRRSTQIRDNNGHRTTPEAALCDEIAVWAGFQQDSVRRGRYPDASTFPSLVEAQ